MVTVHHCYPLHSSTTIQQLNSHNIDLDNNTPSHTTHQITTEVMVAASGAAGARDAMSQACFFNLTNIHFQTLSMLRQHITNDTHTHLGGLPRCHHITDIAPNGNERVSRHICVSSSWYVFLFFFVLISTITSYIYGTTMNGNKTPNGQITMEMMVSNL